VKKSIPIITDDNIKILFDKRRVDSKLVKEKRFFSENFQRYNFKKIEV
jgi:hypothetical protein